MKTIHPESTKPQSLDLSSEDWMYIELAIEGHIEMLRNRFADDPRYIHPAIKYEALLERLMTVRDLR